MATKRQKKQAYKAAKKTAKKYPILVLILVLIIIGLAVGAFILYKNGYFDKWLNKSDTNNTKPEKSNGTPYKTGLSISAGKPASVSPNETNTFPVLNAIWLTTIA